MKALWLAWFRTARLLSSQCKLWLPFVIVAALEAVFIGLVWLAPYPPFSTLLAPPLRYVFSDRILHYPWHLWFLYHAMKYAHLAASMLLGAFMTGIACAMVRQTYDGAPLSLRSALVGGQVRYGTVLVVWMITWGLAKGIAEAMARVASHLAWGLWTIVAFTLLLQALLVYAIPAAVFQASSWWKALWQSVRETAHHPFTTLLVVALPSAAVLAFALYVSEGRVAHWMLHGVPEIVIPLVGARLLVWTVADAIMTVAAAHLWWVHRTPTEACALVGASSPARVATGKPVAALIGLTALLCIGLSLSGCSVSSYNGERLFWKAQQLNAPILKSPNTATPEQFTKAIEAFDRVIRETRGTVWAARAQVAVGSLYALQRQYGQAREAYARIVRDYGQYKELNLAARVATARTYEIEQNWDEAVKVYQGILLHHPWTAVAMEAPIYIARTYEQRQQPAQAKQAYEEAIDQYLKWVARAPTLELVTIAKGYLALTYQRLGRWNDAVRTLEELAKATRGVDRPLILLSLGSIYESQLRDRERAQEVYSKLFQEFPDHLLGKKAKLQLEHLGITVVPKSTSPVPTEAP